MKKSKLGRNEPCSCGSGKKYKNCCLALEGTVERNEKPFDRYSQLIASIKVKLDQQYEAQIRKLRRSFQDRFIRLCTTPQLPREQESFFSDWLWFDVTDSEGETFSHEYLHKNGPFMEEPLRDCLTALDKSYLSVYEPVGMEGDTLRVKDFLLGCEEHILLKEPLDIDTDNQLPLLLGRLVSLPLGKVFSGMVLLLPNDDGQGSFISKHINYWKNLKEEEALVDLLKNQGETLFGLFDRASHKSVPALNDIRVVRQPENISALASALDQMPSLRLAHETGGIRWYDLCDSQGKARIGLSSEYLVSYTDLLDDILRIETCTKDLFSEQSWEIVHSLFLFQPPPPELNHIWYSVLKDQETERWLHTVHRELDDKTPLEVKEEKNGRERIFSMLDSFASQANGNEYSNDLLDYMRQRIQ